MMKPSRRDHMLKALVNEYCADGHSILPEEKHLCAGIIAVVGDLRFTIAKSNLATLANQIDRSLS